MSNEHKCELRELKAELASEMEFNFPDPDQKWIDFSDASSYMDFVAASNSSSIHEFDISSLSDSSSDSSSSDDSSFGNFSSERFVSDDEYSSSDTAFNSHGSRPHYRYQPVPCYKIKFSEWCISIFLVILGVMGLGVINALSMPTTQDAALVPSVSYSAVTSTTTILVPTVTNYHSTRTVTVKPEPAMFTTTVTVTVTETSTAKTTTAVTATLTNACQDAPEDMQAQQTRIDREMLEKAVRTSLIVADHALEDAFGALTDDDGDYIYVTKHKKAEGTGLQRDAVQTLERNMAEVQQAFKDLQAVAAAERCELEARIAQLEHKVTVLDGRLEVLKSIIVHEER